jgi:hypothetical protein
MYFMFRVTVGLGWTRARASNPRFGQGWTYLFCSSGLVGFGCLFERIDRIRVLVRRIESDRHTCSSNTQSEFRLIQKSRIEWSILGLNDQICSTNWAEQAILSEPEPWASSDVLTLGLGFGFCSSDWVGLKKSVRTQLDDHTIHVSLLKSYKKRFDDVITSFSIMINEERHDEMKLILNNKLYRKRLQYLVKWLNWSNIENQWIYAEDVQVDELIKNFHQQYFNKFSTDASNAKRRRIEKNWFDQKKKEFHFNWREVKSQQNYLIIFFFSIQRQIKHFYILSINKTTKRICNIFQKKLILFVNFYEFSFYFVDVFLIESLSRSCRKKWSKYIMLTSKNFDKDDLVANYCFNIRQCERNFFESNWNLI